MATEVNRSLLLRRSTLSSLTKALVVGAYFTPWIPAVGLPVMALACLILAFGGGLVLLEQDHGELVIREGESERRVALSRLYDARLVEVWDDQVPWILKRRTIEADGEIVLVLFAGLGSRISREQGERAREFLLESSRSGR